MCTTRLASVGVKVDGKLKNGEASAFRRCPTCSPPKFRRGTKRTKVTKEGEEDDNEKEEDKEKKQKKA